MSDRDALLAAIVARPDDDAPRLAFADWVDEQPDPGAGDWAAVIRAQVEAARHDRFSPRWLELTRIAAEILRKHKDDWGTVWPSRLGRLAFRRGFRETVEFDGRSFHNLADREFRVTPIRAVMLAQLANKDGRVLDPEIPQHAGWAGVEAVDLAGNRPQVARWFFDEAGPRMPKLRAVGLRGMGLDAWQAANLLASIRAPALEAVDLSRNPLFDTVDPARLIQHPVMARLRWLDLQNTGVNSEVVQELVSSPHTTGLRVLNLGRDTETVPPEPLGMDGLRPLLTGRYLSGLEVLDLSNQDLTVVGGEYLADWPGLSSVRELRLAGNQLEYGTAWRLAESRYVRNLRSLDLTDNPITFLGADKFLGLSTLTMLTMDQWDMQGIARTLAERFPGCFDSWPPAFEPIP
jgi:uncharacterized protein (TIGR02996 family)